MLLMKNMNLKEKKWTKKSVQSCKKYIKPLVDKACQIWVAWEAKEVAWEAKEVDNRALKLMKLIDFGINNV